MTEPRTPEGRDATLSEAPSVTTLGDQPGLAMLDDLENYASADPRDLGQTHISELKALFEDPRLGLGVSVEMSSDLVHHDINAVPRIRANLPGF